MEQEDSTQEPQDESAQMTRAYSLWQLSRYRALDPGKYQALTLYDAERLACRDYLHSAERMSFPHSCEHACLKWGH